MPFTAAGRLDEALRRIEEGREVGARMMTYKSRLIFLSISVRTKFGNTPRLLTGPEAAAALGSQWIFNDLLQVLRGEPTQ